MTILSINISSQIQKVNSFIPVLLHQIYMIPTFIKHRKLKTKLGRNIGFKLYAGYVISQTFVGI